MWLGPPASEQELHQPLQDDGIEPLPVMDIAFGGLRCILADGLQPAKAFPVGGPQDINGIVRIPALDEAQPGGGMLPVALLLAVGQRIRGKVPRQFLQAPVVLILLGNIPEIDRIGRPDGPVVIPAALAVPVGNQDLSAFPPRPAPRQVQQGTGELQVFRIAAGQVGVCRADEG